MYQFSLWMAELPFLEDSCVLRGLHPVIIVSNDINNAHNQVVTVVPLTTNTKRLDIPTRVLIRGQGLRYDSVAVCDQIMPLDKSRLSYQIGYLNNDYDRYALLQGIATQLGVSA